MSISPHLEPMAIATRQSRQLAVCAVREVVQVVAGDQVFGVHMGAILSWREETDSCRDSVAPTIRRSIIQFKCKVLSKLLVSNSNCSVNLEIYQLVLHH